MAWKKRYLAIIICFTLAMLPFSAFSHSGRTNSAGCHNDNINGGSHCHNGGGGSSGGFGVGAWEILLIAGVAYAVWWFAYSDTLYLEEPKNDSRASIVIHDPETIGIRYEYSF